MTPSLYASSQSFLGWTYTVRLQECCCLIPTHTVRVSCLWSKATANVLTVSGSIVKPQPERSRCTREKVSSGCVTWLMTTVNKDSAESAEAGLFTCNSANKAEVCAILCAKTF